MSGADTQAAFYYQNVVAVDRLLDLLEIATDVVAVTLENPDKAKHVDDIIVHRKASLEYIQVKWAKNEATSYTLRNLISADEESKSTKSLIAQLAIGYTSVAKNTPFSIVLYSVRKAGVNRAPSEGFDQSLAAFISDYLQPFQEGTESDYRKAARYKTFAAILTKLQDACGLSDQAEFGSFLRVLKFALNQQPLELRKESVLRRLDALGLESRHFETLVNAVVEWSIARRTVLTSDVLQRLGLQNHFTDRIRQDFPVNFELCVPPEAILGQLEAAISGLDGGYILIEGGPGTGKSTAIRMFQERRSDISLCYYCYIPDDFDLGNPRLQADSLVRSMCLAIRNSFPELELPGPYARYTVELFNQWISFLSQRQDRVIFVIDGLDHADEKEHQELIQSSLLSVLDGIPPRNVFFIVTSRYLDALPQAPRSQIIADPRRRIVMSPLGHPEVEEYFRRRHTLLSSAMLSRVVTLSGGIPLYLDYLADNVSAKSEFDQERYLDSLSSTWGGSIEKFHEGLWLSLERRAIALFVVLAVRREFTEVALLETFLPILVGTTSPIEIQQILAEYKHLISISDARQFTIRHSSFREFVLSKEADLAARVLESIIAWYGNNRDADETWRNWFRHLFETKRYQELLSVCSEKWLAQAWTSFRPSAETIANLEYAWRAAIEMDSLEEFARIGLMLYREATIADNLSTGGYDEADFLLRLGMTKHALRVVWDGDRARRAPLSFATFMLAAEDRRIQIPEHISRGCLARRPPSATWDELDAYFRAQVLIESWKGVVAAIDNCQIITSRKRPRADLLANVVPTSQQASMRRYLKVRALESLFNVGRYQTLNEIVLTSTDAFETAYAKLFCARYLATVGERTDANALAETIDFSLIGSRNIRYFVLAMAASSTSLPVALDLSNIERVAPLTIPSQLSDSYSERPVQEWDDILEIVFVRLMIDAKAEAVYTTQIRHVHNGARLLLDAVLIMGTLWRDGIASALNSPAAIPRFQRALRLLSLQSRAFSGLFQYTEFEAYKTLSSGFIRKFWMMACKFLSPEEVVSLVTHWLDADYASTISSETLVASATYLHRSPAAQCGPLVHRMLSILESRVDLDGDTNVLVAESLRCANTYADCNRPDDALRLRDKVRTYACGIGWKKDYQFTEALDLLRLANNSSPQRSAERLASLTCLAYQLVPAARRRTAAVTLYDIAVAASEIVDPALGLEMLKRFDEHLFREEAIRNLVQVWLKQPSVDPWDIWLVVLTMNYQEDYRAYREETYPAMLAVFTSAVQRGLDELVRRMLVTAEYIFVVAKGSPERAREWTMLANGQEGLASPENQVLSKAEDALAELFQLAESDFNAFTRRVQEINCDRALEILRSDADRLSKAVERLVARVSESATSVSEIAETAEGELAAANPDEAERSTSDTISAEFKRLVMANELSRSQAKRIAEEIIAESLSGLNKPDLLSQAMQRLDIARWIEDLLLKCNSEVDFGLAFSSDARPVIADWITRTNRALLSHWEEFIRQLHWEPRKAGFIALAKRLRYVDSMKALDLLNEAWRGDPFLFLDPRSARQIFDLAFELDASRARRMLLQCFSAYMRPYPTSIVHHIGVLWKYAQHFAMNPDVLFELFLDHNQKLAYGLPPVSYDAGWISTWSTRGFPESVGAYLLSLLEYPKVDIQLAAAHALFEELMRSERSLKLCLDVLGGAPSSYTEWILNVLTAIAQLKPELLAPHAGTLLKRLDVLHLAAHRGAIEVLSHVRHAVTMEPNALDRLERIRPAIASLPAPKISPSSSDLPFTMSRYQQFVIEEIDDWASPGEWSSALWRAAQKRQVDAANAWRRDEAVHLHFNINDNFDPFEIQGPFERILQEAINEAAWELVATHQISEQATAAIIPLLRRCDPSDFYTRRSARPHFVDWLPSPDLSADGFIDAASADLSRMVSGDSEWVILFEDAEQRRSVEGGGSQMQRIFCRVESFIAPLDTDVNGDMLSACRQRNGMPLRNAYRWELMRQAGVAVDGVRPVVTWTERQFRGRHSPCIADVLGEILDEMALPRDPARRPYPSQSDDLQFIEWQEPYDQGRRLGEPLSSGFVLQIKRDKLEKWLQDRRIKLLHSVMQNRNSHGYGEESRLTWHVKEWIDAAAKM